MRAPLRIGILGAARIADEGIVAPARTLGHQLVAVAARDRTRAEAFAAEYGIAKVHDTYADVIADPDVDLVYNALIRLRELVTSGALGDIRSVDLVLAIPAPPDTDPRWSRELAGGATMDLGCYVLDAARHLGLCIGAAPQIVNARATLRAPEIDAAMRVELGYPGGVTGHCTWDMDAGERTMIWSVAGTEGVAASPAFAVPHADNRLVVTRDGRISEEVLGDQTSYTYQLARLAEALRGDEPFPADIDGSVANAELIDECYRRAGLSTRAQ